MRDSAGRVLVISVLANLLLFIGKLVGWFLTGSMGMLSDAVNSGTDVLLYAAMGMIARWAAKKPDRDHPYGHRRAEPLGAILVGAFVSVLAVELARASVGSLISSEGPRMSAWGVGILVISVVVKGALLAPLFYRSYRRTKNPILLSGALDSLSDSLASGVALLGLGLSGRWDSIAGIVLAGWILFMAIALMRENVDYLVGKAPGGKLTRKLLNLAGETPGVLGVRSINAHYVGPKLHVEVAVEVPGDITVSQAHDIGVEVQRRLEAQEEVERAFVHIDTPE